MKMCVLALALSRQTFLIEESEIKTCESRADISVKRQGKPKHEHDTGSLSSQVWLPPYNQQCRFGKIATAWS